MRFDTSQQMRLGQQMKLAPRMIQSMEILQLPAMALQERIEQELESNVALETVEPGLDADEVEAERKAAERDDRVAERELVVGDDTPSSAEDFERLSEMESRYSEAFDNEYSSATYSPSRHSGERDGKLDAMANTPSRGESLTEQLLHQWSFEEVDDTLAAIGAKLIEYIDDDGLLGADLASIVDQNRVVDGVDLTPELALDALAEIQQRLEPRGLGARDQRESLLLQVDSLLEEDADQEGWGDVRDLIENHFDDLLQNRLPRIVQRSGLTMDRIHHAKDLMHRLRLSPGRDLVDDDVPPIVPDVVIEFDEERDEYVAALADGILPVLRVSPKYETMAKDRAIDKSTREFVTNSVRGATWLIESLNQRKNTLLRVVNVVLARQREYFDHGAQHLKPLPMIEVADQLGIHVGTVSRAVSDKWLQTPRGLVALRRFFSGGSTTASGDDMSWEAIKATLKEIVDAEDKSKPLSDEALAKALAEKGISIARRTVVKYRQQLDIPPARRRRVY